jgi:hypothetical protein
MPFRWVTPGALVFIVAWIAFTVGFGFYVANLGSYNSTYGTLGGVVVLMMWLYLSSFILLVAAEINAIVLEKAETEDTPAWQPTAAQDMTRHGGPAQEAGDRPTRGPDSAMSGTSDGDASHGKLGVVTIALGGTVATLTAWRAITQPSAEEDGAESRHADEQPAAPS